MPPVVRPAPLDAEPAIENAAPLAIATFTVRAPIVAVSTVVFDDHDDHSPLPPPPILAGATLAAFSAFGTGAALAAAAAGFSDRGILLRRPRLFWHSCHSRKMMRPGTNSESCKLLTIAQPQVATRVDARRMPRRVGGALRAGQSFYVFAAAEDT